MLQLRGWCIETLEKKASVALVFWKVFNLEGIKAFQLVEGTKMARPDQEGLV